MRDSGYDAEVVALLGEPGYQKLSGRSRFHRLWLRFCMYCLYPLYLIWRVVAAPRRSLFVVTSNTFYAPMLAAGVGRICGKRTVHLLYDLFPDVLEAAGQVTLDGNRSKWIGAIARITQRWCCGTVYLGSFLEAHAERRWGASAVAACVDVPIDAWRFPEPTAVHNGQPLKIRYGGQFGYMHDEDSVAAAVRAATTKPDFARSVSFHFFISGAGYPGLSRQLSPLGVEVRPPIQDANWPTTFRDYPIGMVSLSPGGAAVCLPSKVYGMMAGGQAVLAICPLWSDLARIILENQAGWVINNSPYTSLEELNGDDYLLRTHAVRAPEAVAADFVKTIHHLLQNPAELAQKRENGRAAAVNRYGREAVVNQWRGLLEHIQREGS